MMIASQPAIVQSAYQAQDFSYLIGMQGFSDSLLKLHFKLYEGYVKNVNDLTAQMKNPNLTPMEYGALKRRWGWEYDGMRLHELYFGNLGGRGVLDPKSALGQSLVSQWGSYEAWKKEFVAVGSMRGIGWVLLYRDPATGRLTNTWINEHDGGHMVGCQPILIMDVFEHAYMPQYGLDKSKYIEAFFANINWDEAAARFDASSSTGR